MDLAFSEEAVTSGSLPHLSPASRKGFLSMMESLDLRYGSGLQSVVRLAKPRGPAGGGQVYRRQGH